MKSKHLLLIGAGHTHLHVIAHAHELAAQGIRVTVVDPGTFWYSGLATGVLAGQYAPQEDTLDPRALTEACGGEFMEDRLTSLAPHRRVARLASGLELGYDALSLNIGSRVDTGGLLIGHPHAFTVKPVSHLWNLRQHLEARFEAATETRVVVIGGGPTGSEVAACIATLARRTKAAARVTLLSRGARLMERMATEATANKLARALARRGVQVELGCAVAGVGAQTVSTDDGRTFEAGVVVLATGLHPPPLTRDLGLPCATDGGLCVRATLQSVARDDVFAAGDCASMEGHNLPKLGVFGVRQGPVLLHNVAAFLTGQPLREYTPQQRYLFILNYGDGRALAVRGKHHWEGRTSLWLKDHLDRSFLQRFRARYA